jgi:predicted alpha/beta superfamily hydrolase
VDEAVARLSRATGWPGLIAVCVWNTARRHREYMPAAPLERAGAEEARSRFIAERGGEPLSDGYCDFLALEVKPWIDRSFRTLRDPAHTWVGGSSMGALAALYALERHPEVFGCAACLSTHWSIGGEVLVDGVAQLLPPPGRHRLYFDHGTATLDAAYAPLQQRMDRHLRTAGYRVGADFVTRVFTGHDHSERAWRARLDVALAFLAGLDQNANCAAV